jgi:hypothetical protein
MHTKENPGGGLAQIFAKIPGGGGEGLVLLNWAPHFGFYCILINKFFENLTCGSSFIPLTPLTPNPLCASTIVLRWHELWLGDNFINLMGN